MSNTKSSKKKTKVIKRRQFIESGDEAYPFPLFAHIRMKKSVSADLMKYQGLCCKFGNKESLRFLFEKVCMPAISMYVKPYAKAAEQARAAKKEVR